MVKYNNYKVCRLNYVTVNLVLLFLFFDNLQFVLLKNDLQKGQSTWQAESKKGRWIAIIETKGNIRI